MSVLDDLAPDVDPEAPVVLILWLTHEKNVAYVWEGTDAPGVESMLSGALRHLRREYQLKTSLEPPRSLQ